MSSVPAGQKLERKVNILILEGSWMSREDCKRRDALVRECRRDALKRWGDGLRINELYSAPVDEFNKIHYVIGQINKDGTPSEEYKGYVVGKTETALPLLQGFTSNGYVKGDAIPAEQ